MIDSPETAGVTVDGRLLYYQGFAVPATQYLRQAVRQFNENRSWWCMGIVPDCRTGAIHVSCDDCIFCANFGGDPVEKQEAFADYAVGKGYKITRNGFAREPSANLSKKKILKVAD